MANQAQEMMIIPDYLCIYKNIGRSVEKCDAADFLPCQKWQLTIF